MADTTKKIEKTPIVRFEVWIGQYSLDQVNQLEEPSHVATVAATSFKGACVLHEHHASINHLSQKMTEGVVIENDMYFGIWYYDLKTNSNSWTGRYFETREEALKTFIKD